jgi:peptidoglycan hydrolase-like protein with peptidoglycan-binding domain
MMSHRGLRTTKAALLALTVLAGAGLVQVTAAQRSARPQTAPTRARIIEIQQALAHEGFYSGKPSGKWDAATTRAMKNFQTSKGLTPTGKLGALSLQNLGLGSEIAGKAAPVVKADASPSALSESELDEPGPEDPEEPEDAAPEP